jgi:lysophospholipase L1-like esterase
VISIATTAPIVSFVGASETAGFGLAPDESAYPEILARRCSFVARVDGEVNRRVLFRVLPQSNSEALVLFVSQLDAFPTPATDDVLKWLRPGQPTIIVEAPALSKDESGDVGFYQQRLYDILDQAAARVGASVILLHFPPNPAVFMEPDGLHPNERGQIYIADALQPVLKAIRLCRN